MKKLILGSLTIALSLILPLSGCMTTAERAYEALSKDEIDKGLALANQAVAERAELPENQEVLKQARTKWINRKLIDVRLFRLSENFVQSEAILMQLIKNQSDWQVFPSGVAFATQAEELKQFDERLNEKLREGLNKERPVLVYSQIKKVKEQYGYYLNKDYSKLLDAAKKIAEKQCLEKSKSLSENEYYQIWVWKKNCSLFNIGTTFTKTSSPVKLFSHLQIVAPDSLNSEIDFEIIKEQIDESLNSSFKKSKWADENSTQNMDLKIEGSLTNLINESPVKRYQDYTVSVPYEYEEIQPKQNRSSVSSFFHLLGTIDSPTRERDNGDGTVSITKTGYREDPRIYYYKATEVRQIIKLDWKAHLSLEKKEVAIQFKEQYEKSSDEHGENQSLMGLFPKKRILIKIPDWLNLVLPNLSNQFYKKLSEEWEMGFCEPLTGIKEAPAESILRCAYGAEKNFPTNVDFYFNDKIGLSLAEWKKLDSK